MTTPTISFEIEIALSGTVVPYRPATGPSYASGGDPEEGGYAEDVEIEDVGIITIVPAPVAERGSHPRGVWKTVSILDGIDRKAPEIQKLLANILAITAEEASAAIMDEAS